MFNMHLLLADELPLKLASGHHRLVSVLFIIYFFYYFFYFL